jgi:hypothetical protein
MGSSQRNNCSGEYDEEKAALAKDLNVTSLETLPVFAERESYESVCLQRKDFSAAARGRA